jgi:hypothetical protein
MKQCEEVTLVEVSISTKAKDGMSRTHTLQLPVETFVETEVTREKMLSVTKKGIKNLEARYADVDSLIEKRF